MLSLAHNLPGICKSDKCKFYNVLHKFRARAWGVKGWLISSTSSLKRIGGRHSGPGDVSFVRGFQILLSDSIGAALWSCLGGWTGCTRNAVLFVNCPGTPQWPGVKGRHGFFSKPSARGNVLADNFYTIFEPFFSRRSHKVSAACSVSQVVLGVGGSLQDSALSISPFGISVKNVAQTFIIYHLLHAHNDKFISMRKTIWRRAWSED